MSKVSKSGRSGKHETNGISGLNGHGKPPSDVTHGDVLREHIRQQLGVKQVEIGNAEYQDGYGADTGSFADMAKVVTGVRWLIPNWIPYGMLTGIIAQPKAGKSGFALGAILKPIVTGCNWFNGMPGPKPGYAIYCDTEHSGAINVERMRKWGIPMEWVLTPFKDPLTPFNLEDSSHMTRLFDVICEHKVRGVVIDSFRGGHEGDENNSQIAKALSNLASVAEKTNAAVQVIHHTKKMGDGEELTINSGRGSNAFLAAVRCQIGIDCPDPNSDWRRVQVLGENLGIAPAPIGFRMTDTGLEFGQAPSRAQKVKEPDRAATWLRENMTPGTWYLADDMKDEAAQFSISASALQRAREALGITQPKYVRKRPGTKLYEWSMPG